MGRPGLHHQRGSGCAEAVKRIPNNAQLYADYADAVAMAQGRKLEGEPEKLIARALEIDPRNVKALALAGTVAFERKDYKQAVVYWEKTKATVPPDSPMASSIEQHTAISQAPW